MDGDIQRTRDQLGHPRGVTQPATRGLKHIATGVALLGTVAAGLAGLGGEAGGVPRAAHAASGTTATIIGWCYSCTYPTITMRTINVTVDPLTVVASGTDFTPGGAVHVDLMVTYLTFDPSPSPDGSGDPVGSPSPTSAPGESAPEIVASVDTVAGYAYELPDGTGGVYHVVGGRFRSTMAAPSSICGSFSSWLVATDQATGRTSTSDRVRTGFSCS